MIGGDVPLGIPRNHLEPRSTICWNDVWYQNTRSAAGENTENTTSIKTLQLFEENFENVLERYRIMELRRTKKRVGEKIAAVQELNKQIVEYMVQTGKSCEDMAKFSYRSDMQMDKFEDMIMQIEDVLDKQETNSSQKEVKEETEVL